MMYTNVTTKQLSEMLQKENLNLIDVRENYEYNYGHVEGAKNIPTNEMVANFSRYLKQNEKYYIICQSGGRSAAVCQYLSARGYQVINILGGTSSWAYQLVR